MKENTLDYTNICYTSPANTRFTETRIENQTMYACKPNQFKHSQVTRMFRNLFYKPNLDIQK